MVLQLLGKAVEFELCQKYEKQNQSIETWFILIKIRR